MSKTEEIITERARQLIADATEKFLRTRMQMTQKIVSSKGLPTITLDEFTEGLNNATKNGGKSKWKYYKDNINRIAISDEEIEELVSLVRESITKCFNSSAFSGIFSGYIDDTMKVLYKSIYADRQLKSDEKEAKLKIIEKWRNTNVGSSTSYGIDRRVDGSVSWAYNDEFSIANNKYSLVCVIGFDGTEKLQSDIQVEELLLENNLFTGVAYCRNSEGIMEEIMPVVLLKVDDNTAKSVLDGREFPIGKQEDNDDYVDLILKFNDYLELKGVPCIKEELYDDETFYRIVLIHDKRNSFTDEKKKKISKVADCAVDWWAKVISSSFKRTWEDEYCCECKEEVFDEDGNLIPEVEIFESINDKPKYSEEEMKEFKFNLKNEISAELTLDKECRLGFDHFHACNIINRAASKAGLYKNHSYNNRIESICTATMYVTCEKVIIKPLNKSSEDIVIYDDSNQYYDDSNQYIKKK